MHTYARRHICPSARVNASAALGQLVLVGTCCSHLGSCCTWRALEQRTSEFQVAMRLNKPPGTRMHVGIFALRHFCSWADMMCCACSSAFVLHMCSSALLLMGRHVICCACSSAFVVRIWASASHGMSVCMKSRNDCRQTYALACAKETAAGAALRQISRNARRHFLHESFLQCTWARKQPFGWSAGPENCSTQITPALVALWTLILIPIEKISPFSMELLPIRKLPSSNENGFLIPPNFRLHLTNHRRRLIACLPPSNTVQHPDL